VVNALPALTLSAARRRCCGSEALRQVSALKRRPPLRLTDSSRRTALAPRSVKPMLTDKPQQVNPLGWRGAAVFRWQKEAAAPSSSYQSQKNLDADAGHAKNKLLKAFAGQLLLSLVWAEVVRHFRTGGKSFFIESQSNSVESPGVPDDQQ